MFKKIAIGVVVIGLALGAYLAFGKPWKTFCPGIESNDLTHLDKRLQKKAERIIETLTKEGFDFNISSTYRSPEKQQCYYDISQVIKKVTGQNGLTTVTKSCHNNTVKGTKSSLAIDIHSFSGSMEDQATFYKRLRDLAYKEGLQSGANFKKSNPMWAKYDLGWDPGHIQVSGCKSKIKLQ